jgi:hypothetical protein
VSVDADANFVNLQLPFEWMLNRWNVTKSTSLTLAYDPDEPQNKDAARNGTLLNCGLVIAQNLPRTHEILDAWSQCPDNEERYPGCSRWKHTWPAEQAAFGEYIRYEFTGRDDINTIPCDEANGFPSSGTECSGKLMRHHWTAKGLVRAMMNDAVMYGAMNRVHQNFREHSDHIVYRDGRDGRDGEDISFEESTKYV